MKTKQIISLALMLGLSVTVSIGVQGVQTRLKRNVRFESK